MPESTPPSPQQDHMQLVWHPPFCGVSRVRVLAWTCECRATFYELCQAGGQSFIRRTLQCEPQHEIKETFRWPLRQAHGVWASLLCGEAR